MLFLLPGLVLTGNSGHPSAIFNLFCSNCHYFLSKHGTMMQMLANPTSFAFATSEAPQGVVVKGDSCKPPESCSCKVRDFECGCGARLGYYLASPCEECQEAKIAHKWFLCPRSVEAEPHEPESPVVEQQPNLPHPQLLEKAVEKAVSPLLGSDKLCCNVAKPQMSTLMPI